MNLLPALSMNFIAKIRKNYKIFLKSREQEGENIPLIMLFIMIVYWVFKSHGRIIDFFMLGLHKKGKKINEYISDHEFLAIHDKLNPRYYISILEDKYVFDRFLAGFGFPLAEFIGLLENGMITWIPGRKTEPIGNLFHTDLDCFCKFHTGWGGSMVFHLVIDNGAIMINNKICTRDEVISMTKKGIYVLQKSIKQHSEMNRLNNSCVNTIRIVTIHDGRTIHKYASFIRIGIGKSHVDNISAGNIACGIKEDGFLFDKSLDAFMINAGLTRHPDTNIPFASFKVPFYHEAIDLAIDMHKAFHCFFIIGWDIAITESGPVVIEGNPVSSLILEQIIMGGGTKKEFIQTARDYQRNRKPDL
jgi:hypothetical protein